MRSGRSQLFGRVGLLVAVLLVSTTALAGTEGTYNWTASTTGYVGEFTNSSTGGGVKANTVGSASIGVYGSATGSTAQATRGYNSNGGYGVYGRSVSGTGVYGENNSSSTGYGGYFTGFNGLKAFTSKTNGYAGWFTASGTSGFGVRAQSSGSGSYGVYSTGVTAGVYATGQEGVWGVTTTGGGDALEADASGTDAWGVNAYATGQNGHAVYGSAAGVGGSGGRFYSSQYTGVYADGASGYYDLYAPDSAYIAGTIFPPKGGLALLARNEGGMTLRPGDVAVFQGFDPAALGRGVVLAAGTGAARGVVLGVVQGAYLPDAPAAPVAAPLAVVPVLQEDSQVPPAPVPDGEAPRAEDAAAAPAAADAALPPVHPKTAASDPAGGRFVEESVEAGQYMVVTYLGLVRVSVTARAPIAAGDWIVVAQDGSVTGVSARSYSAALDRGYTIVGRALEPLASGTGLIYVQVSLR